jgi:catechol 2,3-dioxygenase-like lactoylglutathione lyase family enzyme
MKRFVFTVVLGMIVGLGGLGCASTGSGTTTKPAVKRKATDPVKHPLPKARDLAVLEALPLFKFTETDLDVYLKHLHATMPDAQTRLMHLAKKNVGQPYDMYLLGEGPFELYDPDPLYNLKASDCVTYVEFTYAAAMGHDWPSFFKNLMKLRYKDSQIGMVTRNHESVADWNVNNAWLFREVTDEVGQAEVKPFNMTWKPAKFFAKYGIGQDLADVKISQSYIPTESVLKIAGGLRAGDIVQIVRGKDTAGKPPSDKWVGHFALAVADEDGTVRKLVHSSGKGVWIEPILDVLDGKQDVGIKVLRVREQVLNGSH